MVGKVVPSRDAGTRARVLRAATEVFSERGFGGARMEEIARRASANKAMIYYHWGAKQKLYDTILADLFGGVRAQIDVLRSAESDPRKRLRSFYEGLVDRFGERPELPRIMLHEVLAGGRHMGQETPRGFAAILKFVGEALAEVDKSGGRRNPVLVHLTFMGPILLYFVSQGFRARLADAIPTIPAPDRAALRRHIEHLAETLLAPGESQKQEIR